MVHVQCQQSSGRLFVGIECVLGEKGLSLPLEKASLSDGPCQFKSGNKEEVVPRGSFRATVPSFSKVSP